MLGLATSGLWTITGHCFPPALQSSQGRESTLADAKVAIRLKLDEWRTLELWNRLGRWGGMGQLHKSQHQ